MAVLQYPIFHSLNFHLKHLLPTIRVFIFSLRKRGCVQSRAAGTEIWIKAHFYGFLTSTAVSFQYSKRYVFFSWKILESWELTLRLSTERWKSAIRSNYTFPSSRRVKEFFFSGWTGTCLPTRADLLLMALWASAVIRCVMGEGTDGRRGKVLKEISNKKMRRFLTLCRAVLRFFL